MGEKGNVIGAADTGGNVIGDVASTAGETASGIVTGAVTGAASGVLKDKVTERTKRDETSPDD